MVDVSAVGLERARTAAAARGLTLSTLQRDLPVEGAPPGPWDLAVIVRYLDRDLLAGLPSVLADGGLVAFSQPTVVNLERNEHPHKGRWGLPGGFARETALGQQPVADPVEGDDAHRVLDLATGDQIERLGEVERPDLEALGLVGLCHPLGQVLGQEEVGHLGGDAVRRVERPEVGPGGGGHHGGGCGGH